MIAKLDVGARGGGHVLARWFPDLAGLLAYVDKLKGAAKLRPTASW